MLMVKKLPYLLLIIALFGLSGCSYPWEATKKVGQILWDPSTPVGAGNQQPSVITITLLAEPNINKNIDDEPTPVEIQLIYLSEDSRFESMDYDKFAGADLEEVLGKNYIDHQDYSLTPGQYKPLAPQQLSEANRYLGIIVHYSDPNISEWKKVIKLNGVGHRYKILGHIRANEVELRKEEEE